jgi:hypothetical protein
LNSRLVYNQYIRLVIRDGGLCHYCKREMTKVDGRGQRGMSREHIVPVSHGGPNDDDNMVLACRGCNNSRSNTLHVCDCERCLKAYDLYWWSRKPECKPEIKKMYKKWFVLIGNTRFVVDSWESALQALGIKT